MSDNSHIEWTDATWNPVRGCTKVSPGCAHCYAETFAERWRGVAGHPYEQGFDLRLVPEKLTEPLSWKKPRRVFVNSMSDLFQDGVPDYHIDRVFTVMALAHVHTFQVLTKRPERMLAYVDRLAATARAEYRDWPKLLEAQLPWLIEQLGEARIQALCEVPDVSNEWPLPNVWLGVSVENQHFADERIPLLLQTPAAVRFISAEPLLGSVDLESYVDGPCSGCGIPDLDCAAFQSEGAAACCPGCRHVSLDWVIVGGESGPRARSFDVAWARSIVSQCRQACVPVFVKQLGSNPAPLCIEAGAVRDRLWLRHSKGGDMTEWPDDLRVREYP